MRGRSRGCLRRLSPDVALLDDKTFVVEEEQRDARELLAATVLELSIGPPSHGGAMAVDERLIELARGRLLSGERRLDVVRRRLR